MQLREYQHSDCEQLAELFYQTVHSVNAKDDTKEQLDVWVTGKGDLCEWNSYFLKHKTIVAVENGKIVGFGDTWTALAIWTGFMFIKTTSVRVLPLQFVMRWNLFQREKRSLPMRDEHGVRFSHPLFEREAPET